MNSPLLTFSVFLISFFVFLSVAAAQALEAIVDKGPLPAVPLTARIGDDAIPLASEVADNAVPFASKVADNAVPLTAEFADNAGRSLLEQEILQSHAAGSSNEKSFLARFWRLAGMAPDPAAARRFVSQLADMQNEPSPDSASSESSTNRLPLPQVNSTFLDELKFYGKFHSVSFSSLSSSR
jgi:hypothetical protein